ncbi:type II toxin-antitoxin system ParD family antitoxin [Methylobacterium sp. PvR107]|uniref:ribbon-helix-helix domain-containing protein n=1 Tax=Methylobacterium sp. PvR107 TaxID=2806597 RepID=UPI001AE3AB0C|nr:type II toxin-antitoxin system ParD family antitoxin [Methylobacterium sp. PvR107]
MCGRVTDQAWPCAKPSPSPCPPELRTFLQGCVATGRHTSISEVVRAALRELECAERGKASMAQQTLPSHDRS